jgi:hypothetical protein
MSVRSTVPSVYSPLRQCRKATATLIRSRALPFTRHFGAVVSGSAFLWWVAAADVYLMAGLSH